MITGWVIAGNADWSWICVRLKRPLNVMTLGLVGVAGVLSELIMAWRRLPVPLSSSVLTLNVDRSWRPSRDSIAGRRRRATRRREPGVRAFGALCKRWNHRADIGGSPR